MRNPGIRCVPILAVCALMLAARQGRGQELRKMSSAEIYVATKHIDRAVLPEGATELFLDTKQAVHLPMGKGVSVIPVRFAISSSPPFFQCGIFFLPASGSATFLTTFGKEWTEAESCTGLKAIGAVKSKAASNKMPSLALIYEGYTLHSSPTEPVVLVPDTDRQYKLDPDTSQCLAQLGVRTIPGIRAVLLRSGPGCE